MKNIDLTVFAGGEGRLDSSQEKDLRWLRF